MSLMNKNALILGIALADAALAAGEVLGAARLLPYDPPHPRRQMRVRRRHSESACGASGQFGGDDDRLRRSSTTPTAARAAPVGILRRFYCRRQPEKVKDASVVVRLQCELRHHNGPIRHRLVAGLAAAERQLSDKSVGKPE